MHPILIDHEVRRTAERLHREARADRDLRASAAGSPRPDRPLRAALGARLVRWGERLRDGAPARPGMARDAVPSR